MVPEEVELLEPPQMNLSVRTIYAPASSPMARSSTKAPDHVGLAKPTTRTYDHLVSAAVHLLRKFKRIKAAHVDLTSR